MEWTTLKKKFVRCDACMWAGSNPEFFTVGWGGGGGRPRGHLLFLVCFKKIFLKN